MKLHIWSTVFGLSFILLSVALFGIVQLPSLLLNIVRERMSLSQSQGYEIWRTLPIPMYARYYFFNVTNIDDIVKHGAKPKLAEVGPFVYRLQQLKQEVSFHDNDTVSFHERQRYVFDRTLSAEDENVTITTINAPLVISFALIDKFLSSTHRMMALLFLEAKNYPIFIERSVKQLLFEGYEDFLTSLGPTINPKIPQQSSFGWMYGKNDTADGEFNVFSGKRDKSRLNLIDKLDGRKTLSFWNDTHCNDLSNSSRGEVFPALSDGQLFVNLFRSNLCRKVLMRYNETCQSIGDLTVSRFYPDRTVMLNATDYPPNACFQPSDSEKLLQKLELIAKSKFVDFMKQNNISESKILRNESFSRPPEPTFRSGVFDIAGCSYGAPVLLSYPHFLNADPYYLTTVDGLLPQFERHKFFLDVEPNTGVSVASTIRLQVNVFVRPEPELRRYRHVPQIVFPVFWQELEVTITEKIARDIRWALKWPPIIGNVVCGVLIALSFLVMLAIMVRFIIHQTKKSKIASDESSEELITEEPEAEE